jgi:hypothetical protein
MECFVVRFAADRQEGSLIGGNRVSGENLCFLLLEISWICQPQQCFGFQNG